MPGAVQPDLPLRRPAEPYHRTTEIAHRHPVACIGLYCSHEEASRQIVIARAEQVQAELAERDRVVGGKLHRGLCFLRGECHVADFSCHTRQVHVRQRVVGIVARSLREFTRCRFTLTAPVVIDSALQRILPAAETTL